MNSRLAWLPISIAVAASALAATAEHVIVISIDGLLPASYIHPEKHGLKIPRLMELVRQGCASPGAMSVFPSVTYPSHTSMVTGRTPADHGIVDNSLFDPMGLTRNDWYYYAEQIKLPTLWQAVRKTGRITAAVSWPVTVGADIDFNVPDYRPPRAPTDLAMLRALSTPGLVTEIENRFGTLDPSHLDDRFRSRTAAYVFTKHRPALLLLHLIDLDHVQHSAGIGTPRARETLEQIDSYIGLLREEVEKAGLAKKTAWVIVSDHGFLPVRRYFHPKVALRTLGHLVYGEKDNLLSWRVWPRTSGASFALYVKDPADTEAIDQATRYFRALAADPHFGIARLLPKSELEQLGAFPGAFLGVSAKPGFAYGGGITGSMITEGKSLTATHGHDPREPEMLASFLLAGAGVAPCQTLPGARLIDVAPTVAALLGVPFPTSRGRDVQAPGSGSSR